MIKKIMLLLLFILSCKETHITNYMNRHAFIVNIDTKDNLLVYSFWKDTEYAIKVEDLKTDKIIFSSKIKDNCFTEPRINSGKLYFPESNDTFSCIDYKNKKVFWKLKTKGRISEFQFVNDNVIIASIDTYGLVAINSRTGKVLYELLLYGDKGCIVDAAPRPIGFNEDYFFVSDFNCNSIAAYEISSGKKIWNINKDSIALSNFIVAGKYIFLGNNDSYETGKIMLIESKTGKVIYSQDSKFEIMMNPILYQSKIYYYTYDSKLNEFDIEKRTSKIICNFSPADDISGSQIYQLDNFLYFQDVKFNLNRMNLTTLEKEIIGKCPKGLLGVYKINNVVKFVY